ncbi:MAG: NUDIX hydrolase [Neptuniibacter sp.]
MKYCSNCATEIEIKIPQGDNLPRHTCPECDSIFYVNPKVVAGCLPVFEDKVLLCKRAIEPRLGYWTLPAGFMELGESTEEAALRETMEEANAKVDLISLYTLTSITHVSQVQFIYLANLPEPKFSTSNESLEVRLFSESEIPWDELAFPTVNNALYHYFEDRKKGVYPLREIILTGNQ